VFRPVFRRVDNPSFHQRADTVLRRAGARPGLGNFLRRLDQQNVQVLYLSALPGLLPVVRGLEYPQPCQLVHSGHNGSPILRQTVTPDIPAIDGQRAPFDGVRIVALNNRDRLTADLFQNAHMVRRPGIVPHAAVLPVVENVVARGRYIGVVLLPAPQFLEKLDVLLAPAFRRDDAGKSRLNGNGAGKRAAPCVRVFYGVVPGKGPVAAIEVND
jgi:hypothetical protein